MTLTPEEVRQLPIYNDGFGVEDCVVGGQRVRRLIPPRQLQVFWVDDETPLKWVEPDGTYWRLAQYTDGMWCKRRAA